MERSRKNKNKKFSLRKQHSALAPLTDRERYNLDDGEEGSILGPSKAEKKAANYSRHANYDEVD